MTRNLALSALAGGLVSLAAALSIAQEAAVLDELYGRGVHAFFSRDMFRAVDLLGEAIKNGSQDPRAYYFRGLAMQNLGREDDAKLDFKEGARLEAEMELTTSVSTALQRVQGTARLDLETYRRAGRLTKRNARVEAVKRRYEEIEADDAKVLRNRPRPAPPATTRPPVTPTTPPADATDPFGEDAGEPRPTTPPPATPAEDMPEETTDDAVPPPTPKPATPKPATPPAADDPFGSDEPAPATPKPATPAPAEDPDDLFGGDEPAPKPAAPKPATPAPAADADDPFGGDETEVTPPAPKPATPKPAAPKPATPEAADDPFGGDSEPEAAPAADEAAAPAAKPATPTASTEPASSTVPPAAKPGRAGSSLFRAFSKAILPDDEAGTAKKPAAAPLPTGPVEDPFADDPAPAPAKPAGKAAAPKAAPTEELEDPFN